METALKKTRINHMETYKIPTPELAARQSRPQGPQSSEVSCCSGQFRGLGLCEMLADVQRAAPSPYKAPKLRVIRCVLESPACFFAKAQNLENHLPDESFTSRARKTHEMDAEGSK